MKFILVDGNSFCYRAYYAIHDLRTSKGFPTNAVYGFISMLDKLLETLKVDGAALTFDLKGPTFRHKRYANYKIHRPPMPEDLVLQIPDIKKVVEAYRIPIFEKEGYEADDVIATIARKLEKAGHEVFIATGDKDMLQLVSKKIKIVNPQKENLITDEKSVRERFGVEPPRIVDIMALMGDTSDNIPGVMGIGEKTAVKLIGEHGTLEGVLKNIGKLKGDKLKANLEKHKEDARLSLELATVDPQVPIEVDVDSMKLQLPDEEKLADLYRELEFKSLLKNISSLNISNSEDKELSYTLIQEEAAFLALKRNLSLADEWAFDFETTGTDPLLAEPIGISFSFREKEAFYVAFTAKGDLSAAKVLKDLKSLFENKKIKKIGQNLKYEAMILMNFGIRLESVFFDTMVASYVLNPAKPNHNLDDIAMEHLGVRITSITELIGSGAKQIRMDQVDLDRVYRYGCQDSDITFRLYKILKEKLDEKELRELFETIEMPLVMILADMETAGVAIDKKLLKI